MSFRDFSLFAGVCLIWALNTIISKVMISDYHIPPLFFGAARFLVVAIVVSPWLLPAPRPLWRLLVIGVCMGAGTFALTFIGLQTASPSTAAIVAQIGLPITTLLSVVVLGETIHWRRGLGIALSFVGVLIVMWHPGEMAVSVGLLWCAAGAVAGSVAAVMMKQMDGVKPLRFQAWVGLSSFLPLSILSAWLEPGSLTIARAAGWPLVASVLFSALIVSAVAHTLYYRMIQRYEANLVAPLTLMVPLFTIALGVVITHDPFDLQLAIGAAIALTGVLIIALRKNHVAPLLLLLRLRA